MTHRVRYDILERSVATVTLIAPLVGCCIAALLLAGDVLHASDLVLLVVFYLIGVLGITVGYHRLLTHKSFEAPAAVRRVAAIAGSFAAEGPVLYWVALHRTHHAHSDGPGDPHSPHGLEGAWAGVRGLWHAHMGWMMRPRPIDYGALVPDLLRDRVVFRIHQQYFLWLLVGLVLPGLINVAIHQTVLALVTGMVWGGLVRIFLGHHVTWAINSVCHVAGRQPFATGDASRNHGLCAALALGEGWHNGHHAFPRSAKHGLLPGQIDVSYLVIRLLERLGLARRVLVPSEAAIARKLAAQHDRTGQASPQPAQQLSLS